MTRETLNILRMEAGLSSLALWVRFFALGGLSSSERLQDYIDGNGTLPEGEHAMVLQALDEGLSEQGKPIGSPNP